METIFNPFDLIQRREPKKKEDFIIKINKVETILIREPNEVEREGEPQEKELNENGLTEKQLIQTEIPVVMKDKRNDSKNLVNRELILQKIKISIPIEQNVLIKAPSSGISKEIPEKEEEKEQEKEEEKEKEPIVNEPKKTEKRKRVEPLEKEKAVEKEQPFIAINKNEKEKPRQKIKMGVSSYYMNNRKLFISKLSQLFKPYQHKLLEKGAEISCKTIRDESIDFGLLTHQLVVRDYLNLYTPYRGLLLYHGLGSGKTCSSIGIAEGMKSDKKIVLMTPASLKMNFFSELKKCGDVLYKKNNHWEFISIEGEPENISFLHQTLGLSKEYIKENGGAWMSNIQKTPNFAQLVDSDQKKIDEQLNAMIRNKYHDINYNGLTQSKMEELTKNGNPFHDSVVIIDEVHNLVSRIANSLKKKKSIAYQLYQYLMDATNVKIVFLTGTPIINNPREVAILFNMLRGFIKTWSFQIRTTTNEKISKEILLDYFKKEGLLVYDYVEYSGNTLTITRNPFGFVNTYSKGNGEKKRGGKTHKGTKKNKRTNSKGSKNKITKKNQTEENDEQLLETEKQYNQLEKELYEGGGAFEEYSGVRLDEMGNINDSKFQSKIVQILEKYNILITGKPKVVKELCLPDDENLFKELFIDSKGEVINTDLFKRRILGLTSYFRSAQEQLLPSFVKDENGAKYHIVNIPMSQHQFEIYSEIRKTERDDEKNKRKAKKKTDDEDDFTSTYRIYSRSACNFAFPNEHPRPMIGKEDITVGPDVLELDGEFEEDKGQAETEGEPGENEQKNKNEQILEYQKNIKEIYNVFSKNTYLSENELSKYSPKYKVLLENIKEESHTGLHLLYSQFRTLEGIGLFKLTLEANGYVEFKLSKKGGEWTIENHDVDPEKPRFVLYTGTETAEEKEIIRNIYNSTWEFVPPSIVQILQNHSFQNNFYGEVIKLLMITSSGAEGINLRNTRYVHIMEPYWNMVRVDQVVGRARRICSHEDLPKELQTVQVFIYVSTMTEEQLSKNIEMKTQDISKLAYPAKNGKKEQVPFSTDQYLFEIAQIKDSINTKILTSIKETAIDCSLYNTNSDEPMVCYGFGKVMSNNFGSYPTLETDLSEKTEINVKTEKMMLVGITVDGVKYAMDKKTNNVYDFESYKRAKEKKGELVSIGKLDNRTQQIIGEV